MMRSGKWTLLRSGTQKKSKKCLFNIVQRFKHYFFALYECSGFHWNGHLDFRDKGQIISKGLFGVLEVSQKTNARIHRSSKNEFVCSFFGIIRGYQKSFRNFLTFSSDQIYRTYYWNCSSVLCCDRLKFCFYNPGLISFSLCNLWSSCQATN